MKIFYEIKKFNSLLLLIVFFFILVNLLYIYSLKVDYGFCYTSYQEYAAFASMHGTEITNEFQDTYFDYMFRDIDAVIVLYKSITSKDLRYNDFYSLKEDYSLLMDNVINGVYIVDSGSMNKLLSFESKITYFNNYIAHPDTMYIKALEEDLSSDVKERINEIIENKEYNYYFASEANTYFLSYLFGNVWKLFLFECMILAGIFNGYILNYEKENKRNTEECILSSKTGRSIVIYKGLASLIYYFIFLSVILSFTLIFHYLLFDYSPFINTSVNNAFLGDAEPLQVFITKTDMTFIQLLFSYIIRTYVIAFIIWALFYILYYFFHNTLIVVSSTSVAVFTIFFSTITAPGRLKWFEMSSSIDIIPLFLLLVLILLIVCHKIYLKKDVP